MLPVVYEEVKAVVITVFAAQAVAAPSAVVAKTVGVATSPVIKQNQRLVAVAKAVAPETNVALLTTVRGGISTA